MMLAAERATERLQWFKDLEATLTRQNIEYNSFDLLTEVRLDEENFAKIKTAVWDYIRACLGEGNNISEERLLEAIDRDANCPANRTPNGILIPKKEFNRQFNHLHKVVVDWVKYLGIVSLCDRGYCPLICRVVSGTDPAPHRPYASTKPHSDVWYGSPADHVHVFIPIGGDIDRTSIEFWQIANVEAFEATYAVQLENYDVGQTALENCQPYPTTLAKGRAYFMDALVPHRTVRREGRVRISLEVVFRRPTTAENRAKMDEICKDGQAHHYISMDEWVELGSTKFMQFKDTYRDAQLGIFSQNPFEEKTYELTSQLEANE